jgi:hypothetical protein
MPVASHTGWRPGLIGGHLITCHNLDRRCNALLGSCLQAREKVEQFAPVAAGKRVLGHLLAAGRQRRGNPCRTTQLSRDEQSGTVSPGCRPLWNRKIGTVMHWSLPQLSGGRRRLTKVGRPTCIGSVFGRSVRILTMMQSYASAWAFSPRA